MYSNLRTQRRAIDCVPFRNSSARNRLRGWSTPPPPSQHTPPQNDNQYSTAGGGGGMVGGGPVASVASPREKTHTLSSSWRIAKAIDSCLYPSLSLAPLSPSRFLYLWPIWTRGSLQCYPLCGRRHTCAFLALQPVFSFVRGDLWLNCLLALVLQWQWSCLH